MGNHNDTVFEVVVVHHNPDTKETKIVLGPKAMLARNEDKARLCAAREVDEKYDCNNLSIKARSFI